MSDDQYDLLTWTITILLALLAAGGVVWELWKRSRQRKRWFEAQLAEVLRSDDERDGDQQ